MEDSLKDQTPVVENSGGRSSSRLLRYPLRSATKPKADKLPAAAAAAADSSHSSAGRGGRSVSSVSKSMGVIDLSGKEKSAKPPRRLSVPAKSAVTPVPKSAGNITPISETRAKRSANNQGKSDTPVSDVSRSSNRRRSSVLSSASYWLTQIKLSESAAMHSISISFFKLALEAGCEPRSRLREELKSYARRHNLLELGEHVKELFERYGMLETFEQLQVSETCSHVPEEGTRSSDDDVHSTSSISGTQKLKPKSLNTDAIDTSPVKQPAKETMTKKKCSSVTRIRASVNESSDNSKSATEIRGRNTEKKSQKPSKQESNKEKEKVKKQGKNSAHKEGPISTVSVEESLQDDKENLDDAHQMEEMTST